MPMGMKLYKSKCPECKAWNDWSYEKNVYEGRIECYECGIFFIVDEEEAEDAEQAEDVEI